MGYTTLTMGACTFVVVAVSFWCAIRAYDEQGCPIGFYHVMLTSNFFNFIVSDKSGDVRK